jgi:hypothetical protein
MDKYVSFSNIPANINKVKIDIGLSADHPHSRNWLSQDNDLYVFGFEPNVESVNILKNIDFEFQKGLDSNPERNQFLYNLEHNFLIIPVALGNVSEVSYVDFYQMDKDCGTSSLYAPIDKTLGPVKSIIKTPLYSLKHFFDIFDWDRFPYIEYIKIDAQGSDYNILLGAGDYLKDKVVYITAEPEHKQYENSENNTTENITNYLESQGFIQVFDRNTRDPTFLNKKYEHLKDAVHVFQCF